MKRPTMKYTLIIITTLLLAPLAVLHAADTKSPTRQVQSFDIRSYGAVGDGQTVNTSAILKAFDGLE